jgi:hypothetical protein
MVGRRAEEIHAHFERLTRPDRGRRRLQGIEPSEPVLFGKEEFEDARKMPFEGETKTAVPQRSGKILEHQGL